MKMVLYQICICGRAPDENEIPPHRNHGAQRSTHSGGGGGATGGIWAKRRKQQSKKSSSTTSRSNTSPRHNNNSNNNTNTDNHGTDNDSELKSSDDDLFDWSREPNPFASSTTIVESSSATATTTAAQEQQQQQQNVNNNNDNHNNDNNNNNNYNNEQIENASAQQPDDLLSTVIGSEIHVAALLGNLDTIKQLIKNNLIERFIATTCRTPDNHNNNYNYPENNTNNTNNTNNIKNDDDDMRNDNDHNDIELVIQQCTPPSTAQASSLLASPPNNIENSPSPSPSSPSSSSSHTSPPHSTPATPNRHHHNHHNHSHNHSIINTPYTPRETEHLIRQFCSSGKGPNLNTPLHLASYRGHLHIVQYLIESCHMDVNIENKDSSTALQCACSKNHRPVAQYLMMSPGIDLAHRDQYGYNAFHLALISNHFDIANDLLSCCSSAMTVSNGGGGGGIRGSRHGSSHGSFSGMGSIGSIGSIGIGGGIGGIGIGMGSIDSDMMLLDSRRFDGRSGLHLMCEHGNLDGVRFLLESHHSTSGLTRDQKGDIPIGSAIRKNREHVVRYMCRYHLRHGTMSQVVKMRNELGRNIVHLAVDDLGPKEEHAYRMVRVLMESLMKERSIQWVEVMLEQRDKVQGYTVLHLAARRLFSHVVRLLIKVGAPVNAQDERGNTPLHCVLLAKPTARQDKVLFEANRLETVKSLLSYPKCKLNVKNNAKQTPDMLIRAMNNAELSQVLRNLKKLQRDNAEHFKLPKLEN